MAWGGHGDRYPHERRNLAPQKFGEKIPHHHREFHSQALRPLGDGRLHQALIAIPEHAEHAVRDNRRRKSCAEGCGWRRGLKSEQEPSGLCQSGLRMNTSRQWRGLEGTGLRSGAWATKSSKDPVRQRAIRGQRGGRAALMRINIWIVLAVLLALLATTRLLRDQHETQRICADDPSASVCRR